MSPFGTLSLKHLVDWTAICPVPITVELDCNDEPSKGEPCGTGYTSYRVHCDGPKGWDLWAVDDLRLTAVCVNGATPEDSLARTMSFVGASFSFPLAVRLVNMVRLGIQASDRGTFQLWRSELPTGVQLCWKRWLFPGT
jgi:hypothetical protein